MSARIRLLGTFSVVVDGHAVPNERFGGRRARSLICLLAVSRDQLVPRDIIVEALWGDRPPADPSANVDVLASRARKALADPRIIRSASGGLVMPADAPVEIDAERLSEAVQRGRNYQHAGHTAQALTAYREALGLWGAPLPDETYSDWAAPFRTEMAALRQAALEDGARAALSLGNLPTAADLAREAVEAEPLREVATLLLVSALDRTGDQVAALRAFDRFRVALREELGLDPSSDAFEVQSRILRGIRQTADGSLAHLVPAEHREVPDPRAALRGRGSGPMRARTLASLALLAAGSDDYRRAAELVELALADAGDDQRARAEALYAGSIVDMNLGDLARADERALEALGHFEMLDDAQGVADILDGRAMAAFLAGRVAEGVRKLDRAARLFRDSGDLARVVTPRSTSGHGLIFMGDPAKGLRETEEALEIAVSLGERESEAYARWHRSEALAALGRGLEAVEEAAASLTIAEEIGHREWTAAALRAVGIARRAAGDLDGAADAHTRGTVASEGIPLFYTWNAAGLALCLCDAGRYDDAAPWVAGALGAGSPPLGLYEARLAEAIVARASADPQAPALASALADDATAGGHKVVADAAAALLGVTSG